MTRRIVTHTIAFAPSKGPSLLDRFIWEQIPQIARALGEKEIRIQIAPEKPFAQWHTALHRTKPFVASHMEKLLEKQAHFGIKAAFKERANQGEITIQLPIAQADEFLSAHNIFLQACMPFLQVYGGKFSIDFTKTESSHVVIQGEERVLMQLSDLVRTPHLLATKTKPKKATPKKRGKR